MEGAGKTRAIVAHITLIGWIIAYVQNNNDKSDFASFYIRQMLGLVVLSLGVYILSMFPIIGFFLNIIGSILLLVLWIVSLMGAINGKKEPTPFIGHLFQIWFKSV